MWILPKQLHTSASVADTAESDLESNEFCQACVKSLMWRSKPSQLRTWLRRWKRNNFLRHLSSRMLKPSHTNDFLDAWTFYQGDSRVNRLAPQDKHKRNSEGLATQASNWTTPLANDAKGSDYGYSNGKKVQYLGGQAKNWSTPTVMDTANIQQPRKPNPSGGQKPPLCQEVMNFPTPRTSDAEGGQIETFVENGAFKSKRHKSNQTFGAKLRDAVESWHSPMVDDSKNLNPSEKRRMSLVKQTNIDSQADQMSHSTNGNNLVLNPDWVEQLMGIPVGWTDLGYWETE